VIFKTGRGVVGNRSLWDDGLTRSNASIQASQIRNPTLFSALMPAMFRSFPESRRFAVTALPRQQHGGFSRTGIANRHCATIARFNSEE
jgi:hypothetical protein